MRTKKSLGQHFLKDSQTARTFLEGLSVSSNTPILEIGPGRGAITKVILERTENYFLIEKDQDLEEFLIQSIGVSPSRIQFGDASESGTITKALDSLLGQSSESAIVISNLPYNVGTLIFLELLKEKRRIQELVLTFQKEVAERIAASEGSKKYSSLSVLAQNDYRVSRHRVLKPGAFLPPPEVDSWIIRLERRISPLIAITDFDSFEMLLRYAFHYRRKTILNSLIRGDGNVDWKGILSESDIDDRRRAESLKIEEFGKIYGVWKKFNSEKSKS